MSYVLLNTGTVTHEFQVGPPASWRPTRSAAKKVLEVADITGGQVAELTYTFPAAGAYAFACHVTGH